MEYFIVHTSVSNIKPNYRIITRNLLTLSASQSEIIGLFLNGKFIDYDEILTLAN